MKRTFHANRPGHRARSRIGRDSSIILGHGAWLALGIAVGIAIGVAIRAHEFA